MFDRLRVWWREKHRPITTGDWVRVIILGSRSHGREGRVGGTVKWRERRVCFVHFGDGDIGTFDCHGLERIKR